MMDRAERLPIMSRSESTKSGESKNRCSRYIKRDHLLFRESEYRERSNKYPDRLPYDKNVRIDIVEHLNVHFE